MNRRHFLQSALYGSLIYGVGGTPGIIKPALAGFEPVQNNLLVNLFLSGGPDIRHFIVPEFDSNQNSFGYKYWSNRWRAHDLTEDSSTWQQRWSDDYYKITVGGSNWNGSLVDIAGINNGVTFGIWKHAGWLIDMFRAGNVAIVSNAVGGRNRAHDLSSLQMHQGNLLSGLNDSDRSGWGGRLARSAGGNSIAITNSPLPFTFGPVGSAPNYDVNGIDNRDLVAVQNSREMGLNEADLTQDQLYRPNERMARALKQYYTGLRNEQISLAYEKFRDHEQKVRQFGELIRDRLSDLPLPLLIDALRNGVEIGGQAVNPDSSGDARRVLRSGYSFGAQIRNLYDVLAANDLLNVRTVSMYYGGWDSHGDQRQNAGNLDINDPNVNRGIESGFKDIFGGQFGASPSDSNALHSGFSALWESLNSVDRQKMVITVAGEFGRQIRDNGDAGTDHGKGNTMFIIGEGVTGGVYGEMFQDDEVDKYDDSSLRTPDIEPRTDLDSMFASVCDWVQPNSGDTVFPRTASGFSGEQPEEEVSGMFQNLMS
ncbi:hypothetical protein NBRC116583_05040 [Arenicella sp. 4NH20-0111]|uniref:DUF1501 domain-containing protein n=1 Tax=Arenicella sp. 4NH20-0111 TaxID=3127648 RepID=UPI0031056ED2